ncbi:pyridoxal-phosphate dependent enzyme [Streptomyces sp. NPDC000229]|uniref:pyridoxal-phosphate dependent enzyme n=1 Tax=Streptomyces sp. NPDC000229 TaxID=3154247 RepID=UPI0033296445
MYDHIADAVKLPDLVRLEGNLVVARFETMKVYSALAAVEHLLRTGRVRPGDTLMDSSSGTYAASLALACHKYGMKCHIVCSTKVDPSVVVQLELLGAVVDQVAIPPGPLVDKMDLEVRLARVHQLLAERDDIHWMQQYHEDYHYLGYRDCARLIHQQCGDGPLTLVGGVGSGASTGALTTYLRDLRGDTDLIGVQPFESVTFGSDPVEDPVASISGIGSPVPFRNVRHALYDRVHWIAHEQAIAATVALYREHGVFAGMSSGCTYLAAAWEARLNPHRQYVFIAADTGHRYMDSVYRKHASVTPVTGLEPKVIDDLGDLSLPWSAMDWHRRPFATTPDECPGDGPAYDGRLTRS